MHLVTILRNPAAAASLPKQFQRLAATSTGVASKNRPGNMEVGLKSGKPLLIVCAAELRTGSAFYFSANESGSWRLGRLALTDISLAHAVAASAAYPLLLPALDEAAPFDRRDGSRRVERISLTDGGLYESLGLAPLWPDRDPSISLNVKAVDTIICCRAGYGLRHDPPSQFMIARLKECFRLRSGPRRELGTKTALRFEEERQPFHRCDSVSRPG